MVANVIARILGGFFRRRYSGSRTTDSLTVAAPKEQDHEICH
jgi:hypothetical protein